MMTIYLGESMKEIWLAVRGIDDHDLLVDGIFDNREAAEECLKYEGLNLDPLVYKINLNEVKSKYTPEAE